MVEFKEAEGHCDVPKTYNDNPGLGRWVFKQQEAHYHDVLDPERERRLQELGVVFRYEKLRKMFPPPLELPDRVTASTPTPGGASDPKSPPP